MFLSFYFCSKSFIKCIDFVLYCVIIESSKGKQSEKEDKMKKIRTEENKERRRKMMERWLKGGNKTK